MLPGCLCDQAISETFIASHPGNAISAKTPVSHGFPEVGVGDG